MLFNLKKAVVDINQSEAALNFSRYLKSYITTYMDHRYKSLVFLCIGTDRSTGDSLGPIIGYKLQQHLNYKDILVYGTLEEPVHAKNLTSKMMEISLACTDPFIVAIDACLGYTKNIGNINISKGPIYPGAGVNKNLLPVGDINVTGIVNASGYMEYFVLQNTRLFTVMKMAEVIADGIIYCIDEIYREILANRHSIDEELFVEDGFFNNKGAQ